MKQIQAIDMAQNRPLWRLMSTFGTTQWCLPKKRRRKIWYLIRLTYCIQRFSTFAPHLELHTVSIITAIDC